MIGCFSLEMYDSTTILQPHLGSSLGLRLIDKAETFQFFSCLFNLEEWAEHDQLRDDTGVDRQIVKNPVAWHNDHVRVGKRHVQMFSLKQRRRHRAPVYSLVSSRSIAIAC
jgi:type IV secretion system protein VirB4